MDKRVRDEIASRGFAAARSSSSTRCSSCASLLRPAPAQAGGSEEGEGTGQARPVDGHAPELVDEGRRVLLFSQFTSMLDLIEAELVRASCPTCCSPATPRRETPIRRFQDGEVPIFLISLKAGGVGLNLTAATPSSTTTRGGTGGREPGHRPPTVSARRRTSSFTSSSSPAASRKRSWRYRTRKPNSRPASCRKTAPASPNSARRNSRRCWNHFAAGGESVAPRSRIGIKAPLGGAKVAFRTVRKKPFGRSAEPGSSPPTVRQARGTPIGRCPRRLYRIAATLTARRR